MPLWWDAPLVGCPFGGMPLWRWKSVFFLKNT